MIVLDTHVLAWASAGDRKLGRKARSLIDRLWARGEAAACALSFWEAALLHARDRLDIRMAPGEWRAELLAAGLIELPVDGDAGIRAVGLGGLPSDPVDRLIVATTLGRGAELMTADERLLAWQHPLVRHDARS
ncbi:MAG: type II toxin-antitoxin system VapC family toxin [Burkholderiales bacterium]|nr:type II toxin-antitoxin system VapC family toxin [Burkholderiales bacterium]